jgi:hypothetical protein
VKKNKIASIDDKSRFARIERDKLEEVSHFLFALGNQFVNIKNSNAAFDCFKYSVDLNPLHQPSVYNLGALYNVTGNLEGAERMFREARRMKPNDIHALTALGEVVRKLGKLSEARVILEKAYAQDPQNYIVISAMAVLFYDLGLLDDSMLWNDKVLEQKPDDIHAILNRVLVNMTKGDWANWWAQYEYCLSYRKNEKMKGLTMQAAWAGQEMPGKTLLIVSDQGAGDAIQFAKFIADAKALGKFDKVKYLVPPDLVNLLARVDGVDEAIGFGERSDIQFDAYSALLGIMRVLKIDPATCGQPPHVITDEKLDDLWNHRINALHDGDSLKVGLCWAGDPKHGNDQARSVKLIDMMKEFAAIPRLQFFSFQVGTASKQIQGLPEEEPFEIEQISDDFRNYDDTASALKQMDVLVSVDTSVAHLAGGLGIPVSLLITNPPEWRWLNNGQTVSDWYERNFRLFRQKNPRDWEYPIKQVSVELFAWSKNLEDLQNEH